jgi:uncharacterized protein YpiB (UPF0302 family)
MITEIISHCTNILALLDRDYKVSDEEWFLFIKKAIILSDNIEGFSNIRKNATEKFNLKFFNLSKSAKDILKNLSINDY